MDYDLNKEILWVLKEIKKAQILCERKNFPIGEFFLTYKDNILFKEKSDGPDAMTQWRIMDKLKDDGFIIMQDIPYLGSNNKEKGINVKLIEPQFSLLLEKLDEFVTEKKDKKEIYIFNDYEKKPSGKLTIGNYQVSFNKIPAVIIHYFYELSKITDEYKNYKDYNEFLIKERPSCEFSEKVADSDIFNKKINAINKKVYNNTKHMIENIFEKGKTKRREPNIYRWNKKVK